MLPMLVMFPGLSETFSPTATLLPIDKPSVATTSVVSPSGSLILARGAEAVKGPGRNA